MLDSAEQYVFDRFPVVLDRSGRIRALCFPLETRPSPPSRALLGPQPTAECQSELPVQILLRNCNTPHNYRDGNRVLSVPMESEIRSQQAHTTLHSAHAVRCLLLSFRIAIPSSLLYLLHLSGSAERVNLKTWRSLSRPL